MITQHPEGGADLETLRLSSCCSKRAGQRLAWMPWRGIIGNSKKLQHAIGYPRDRGL